MVRTLPCTPRLRNLHLGGYHHFHIGHLLVVCLSSSFPHQIRVLKVLQSVRQTVDYTSSIVIMVEYTLILYGEVGVKAFNTSCMW